MLPRLRTAVVGFLLAIDRIRRAIRGGGQIDRARVGSIKMSASSGGRKLAAVLLGIGVACLAILLLGWFLVRSTIADVICAYGEASFRQGQIDKGMTDYTWAVRIDPKLAVAWSDRGLGTGPQG